jgi:hypothetical protein
MTKKEYYIPLMIILQETIISLLIPLGLAVNVAHVRETRNRYKILCRKSRGKIHLET